MSPSHPGTGYATTSRRDKHTRIRLPDPWMCLAGGQNAEHVASACQGSARTTAGPHLPHGRPAVVSVSRNRSLDFAGRLRQDGIKRTHLKKHRARRVAKRRLDGMHVLLLRNASLLWRLWRRHSDPYQHLPLKTVVFAGSRMCFCESSGACPSPQQCCRWALPLCLILGCLLRTRSATTRACICA